MKHLLDSNACIGWLRQNRPNLVRRIELPRSMARSGARAGLGTPIGPNDLMIAAIALANGLTLVTHNTSEFSRVPGLALEANDSPSPMPVLCPS